MIKINSVSDLKNIDSEVRKVIVKHIAKNNMTPTGFAKEVGIHPLQVLRYINEGKNFRFDTLLTIGKNIKVKK